MNSIVAGIIAFVALLCVLTIQQSYIIVQEGYVGVQYYFGSLSTEILQPGLHFKIPHIVQTFPVQITLQTDQIQKVSCGTSSGVTVVFDKIEVVNQLSVTHVYEIVKNYTVDYDKVLIFDRIAHEMNQYCSKNTLQQIFIDKFDTLDEMLTETLQLSLDEYAPGLRIKSIRLSKPVVPKEVEENYKKIVEYQTEMQKSKIAQLRDLQAIEAENLKNLAKMEAQKQQTMAQLHSDQAQKIAQINATKNLELAQVEASQQKHLAEIEAEEARQLAQTLADHENQIGKIHSERKRQLALLSAEQDNELARVDAMEQRELLRIEAEKHQLVAQILAEQERRLAHLATQHSFKLRELNYTLILNGKQMEIEHEWSSTLFNNRLKLLSLNVTIQKADLELEHERNMLYAEYQTALHTKEWMSVQIALAVANNSKIFYGERLPNMFAMPHFFNFSG